MEIIFRKESFDLIGICMEVHRELGIGYAEVVYKDALEIEFKELGIPYEREKPYPVFYKQHKLNRSFNVDFLVFGKIILEVKAASAIAPEHEAQTLNYLACAQARLGIIANFGALSFQQKRLVFNGR
jgi:GxxExxY protein